VQHRVVAEPCLAGVLVVLLLAAQEQHVVREVLQRPGRLEVAHRRVGPLGVLVALVVELADDHEVRAGLARGVGQHLDGVLGDPRAR
jgi:hypothetical protein